MARSEATLAIVFGILAGIAGFLLYDYVTCVSRIGDLCFGPSRPYGEVGILLMVFGGILFVVGVVLTALRERPATGAAQTSVDRGKYCTNCGALNPFEAQFCSSCGQRFEGSR